MDVYLDIEVSDAIDDYSDECEHIEDATIDGRIYVVATHDGSKDGWMHAWIDGWIYVWNLSKCELVQEL